MDGKHTHASVCICHGDAQLPRVDTPKQTEAQGKVSNHKAFIITVHDSNGVNSFTLKLSRNIKDVSHLHIYNNCIDV